MIDRLARCNDYDASIRRNEEMNKPAQARKIQEAYRTSKGITRRQFFDKESSLECQIEMERVMEYFARTWQRPEDGFIKAEQSRMFHLEPRMIEQEEEEDMEELMLDQKNVTEVIKSRGTYLHVKLMA
jgi:hypothetical protein